MEFKKCIRCGVFFTSTDVICENCISKDNLDIMKLQNYFIDNEEVPTFSALVKETGISEKNLMRHLQTNNFIEGQNKIFE